MPKKKNTTSAASAPIIPSFFRHDVLAVGAYVNEHIASMNSSKYFAGFIMILINVGSKFITIKFSKSSEIYLKKSVNKQLLVFAMAWLGTRDIYTALALMLMFVFLSDYAFNEETSLCIVPHKYRVLHTLIDTDEDGVVSDEEMAAATALLNKAKRDRLMKQQKEAFAVFKQNAI